MSDPLRDLPTRFDDYVGQDEIKRRLGVYIEEAKAKNTSLPHVLLTATPGQGKTALAHVIATELGDPLTVFDITHVQGPQQFLAQMRRFRGGCLFVDEIHRGKPHQLEGLLTLMEEGYIGTPGGGRLEVKWLTVIAATTNPEKMDKNAPALRSRFPIQPEFVPYTDEEATDIVVGMARRGGVEIPTQVAEGLGRAAAGTPRMARNLVMAYRALTQSHQPGVDEVLDLVGIDSEGLGRDHGRYLEVLYKLDGLAGEANIRNMMQVAPEALKDIERVLFRKELITFTPRGRALTGDGWAKVEDVRTSAPATPGEGRQAFAVA